ncbi:glycoside hydrolase family 16 protein [Dothidotthia symphoricarpi CBS 119687]|uniref:Glycoside hydrolase family 16 protein n=1 Tax=Dothidotthia symphoricarpi CBS 119687 TaxID=1392245 RepID=A0A6A6A7G6_9PLEO|nr:glycoside hydrolase family 16 protein [Dothidotthia symphoricarpi CBS 119687]KAF2126581.1 glycoside hydrolase family 16 protein [Dothidotthia symphoricarpi CBS 119687]
MFRNTLGALPWLLFAVSRFANAACECGYSLNSTTDAEHAVFTELLENDFLHTDTKNLTQYGWRPQVYNVSTESSRGPFGKKFELDNIVINPLKDDNAWSGNSKHGGDAGLELWVSSNTTGGYVQGAEVVSVRDDALLGSFRVGMKMSNASGTCGAFFFYHNNSQEIDMEFLSTQFNSSGGSVNLVLQTPESVVHGYDASGTPGFEVQPLPFRPDGKFHEYRFDWTADRVAFYVDGEYLHEMTENIPNEGGGMFFNHWSNGDPKWSAGPPESDAVMTVSYVKAYFNSTDTERSQDDYKKRCPKFDASKVCQIPAQTSAPDASTGTDGAKTYFFSTDSGNKAVDQTVYNAASPFSVPTISIIGPLLVALFSWSLA